MLSINEYNEKEIIGKATLPNRFIRAFKPVLFESGGFPTNVYKEQELIRYIDSMHAYSLKKHFDDLLNGLTDYEFSLLKRTTKSIYNFTKKEYDGNFIVKAPMLAALYEKRLIDAVVKDESDRVMELGGGSGTLGCLLLNDNYNYVSTDVTQSFYLIQNRLFDHITGGKVNELTVDKLEENANCIHMPYWKMWETRNEPLNIDVLTSNHALLEMSPNSLRFYLNYFKSSMDDNKGSLVFQGGGWRINQNLIDLINLFDEYGYHLKYFDHYHEVLAFDTTPESVKDEVISELKMLLLDAKTDKIHALGYNIVSRIDKDKIYYCGELGNKINDYLVKINNQNKISFADLVNYYETFININDTFDDEFAEYISSEHKTKGKVKKR